MGDFSEGQAQSFQRVSLRPAQGLVHLAQIRNMKVDHVAERLYVFPAVFGGDAFAPVGAALHFEGPALGVRAAAKRLGGVAAFSAYLDTPISRREFPDAANFVCNPCVLRGENSYKRVLICVSP